MFIYQKKSPVQAAEIGLEGMIPENLTPTTIKMIPRVLPNQKERFETEEIFKRNAQTSEASKHFLTYSKIKVYFYFCFKHLNFFCREKQLLCHI